MSLHVQPIRIATGHDEEGMLVLTEDNRLAAVLVRLSDHNEIAPGEWFLETGFGHFLDGPDHPTFPNLDDAQDWITQRLARR